MIRTPPQHNTQHPPGQVVNGPGPLTKEIKAYEEEQLTQAFLRGYSIGYKVGYHNAMERELQKYNRSSEEGY